MMKRSIIAFLVLLMVSQVMTAQSTTVQMHRRVAQEDMKEYLDRELTYWGEFAKEQIKNDKMIFWGVFVRVGGIDIENEPNVLIINEYKNIDEEIDWQAITKMFPDKTMKDIGVDDISALTSVMFLRSLRNHVQAEKTVAEEEFNFMKLTFHHSKDVRRHLNFEKEKVKPLFKQLMEDGNTVTKGWGNSIVLAPQSPDFPYQTTSYDLFSNLTDALSLGTLRNDAKFPEGFFDEWNDNYIKGEKRMYRIVKVYTPGNVDK